MFTSSYLSYLRKIYVLPLVLLLFIIFTGEAATVEIGREVLSSKPFLDVEIPAMVETATFALG